MLRGMFGSWRGREKVEAGYHEMTWRFNNRKSPFLFRDAMLRLIESGNLEYRELTAEAA